MLLVIQTGSRVEMWGVMTLTPGLTALLPWGAGADFKYLPRALFFLTARGQYVQASVPGIGLGGKEDLLERLGGGTEAICPMFCQLAARGYSVVALQLGGHLQQKVVRYPTIFCCKNYAKGFLHMSYLWQCYHHINIFSYFLFSSQ